MDDATRTKALRTAVDAAVRAGREVLLPRLRTGRVDRGVEKKGPRDLVTEADRLAEERIVAAIRAAFPTHKVVAEEAHHEAVEPGDVRWYIDPLDGTTNFVHGIPCFCVSIACYGPDGGEAAAIYAPYLDELFTARRGGGARMVRGPRADGALAPADEPLAVSDASSLMEACLVSGFHYDMDRYPNAALWSRLLPRTRGLRRLGSAALDLAYVAAGRFDGMWESGLNPFDIAAGCLMVQEAGGRVTDYDLGAGWLDGRTMLATNGALHAALHEEIQAARGRS